MIRLGSDFCGDYLLVKVDWDEKSQSWQETGRDILVQTDWDFPGTASTFGWIACNQCNQTDGTVDCDHHTVSEMIQDAIHYLDDHIGNIVEDPGYFS